MYSAEYEYDYSEYSDVPRTDIKPVKTYNPGEEEAFKNYIKKIAREDDKASVSSKGSHHSKSSKGSHRSSSSKGSHHSKSSRSSHHSSSSKGSHHSKPSSRDYRRSSSSKPVKVPTPMRPEPAPEPKVEQSDKISKQTIEQILDRFTNLQLQQMCSVKGKFVPSGNKKQIIYTALGFVSTKTELMNFILGAFPDSE